jgi:hypothetical protein
MAMNERPEVTDDSIKSLLAGRAARAKSDGLLAAVRDQAAATPQRRFGRLGFELIRGPVAAGVAGMASLVVLVLALGIASGGHLPGVATPSVGPSAGTSAVAQQSPLAPATPPTPPAAGPVLPLAVDQLNALMASDPRLVAGRELVINGTVGRCLQRGGFCPPVILVGSNPELAVVPAIGQLSGPWDSPGEQLIGAFAARLINGKTLEYDAPVQTTADEGAFLPSQLVGAETANRTDGYRLVRGWIAGLLYPVPCPATLASPSSGPQFGCGETAILSDTAIQPQTSNSFTIPPTSARVQNGAYSDFAPAPTTVYDSSPAVFSVPEQATFLVRTIYLSPCPSGLLCPIPSRVEGWEIIARVDPWPVAPVPQPTPNIESPAPSPDGGTAVRPLTVEQLNLFMRMNSQSPEGRQLVITGTIVPNTMAMLCVPPCTGWLLKGSNPTLFVEPVGDVGPGPWNSGGAPLTGTFAATLVDGYRLDYQGPVSTASDGKPWLPGQLPFPFAPSAGTGSWLVQGWLGGPSVIPSCVPTVPARTPYPGPQYGCGEVITFGDNPPGGAGGWVRVQDDAYQEFAPSPSRIGSGTQPEQATFLLRATYIPPCGPTADCLIPPANYHWEIVARVGPWPFPTLP